MKSLRMRLFLASLAIFAVIAGCSDDSGPPTGPTHTIGLATTVETGDCGAAEYLTALSPILPEWQDSLTSALQESFDDPPAFTSESVVEEYLAELAPVLQQWQTTINTTLDSAVVDTVPDFDPGDSVPDYLNGLSDLLQQWRSALNNYFERSLLPPTPVYQGDTASPVIICPDDTIVTCADSSGIVVDFDDLIMVGDDCDASPEVVCDPASGSTFPLGETIVSCTATDSVGNTSECSFTVTVEAATPPVIDCPDDTTVACTGPDGAVVEFEVIATSECDTAVTLECEPVSGSTFPLGENLVKCTATDSFGNTVECTFNIFVVDSTPPVITCPSDTTLECTGDGGAVLDFAAEATDVCDPNPVIEYDPPPGSTFPLGETVVTCTARDASGNTASCSFTVTVRDTRPPVIGEATATPDELWPPNHKMKNVALSVDVTDICDASLDCYIYDVTSNEDVNGLGDGNTEPDWMITGDLTVKLRAERSGLGKGRTYYLHVRCEDDSGNTAERVIEVYVPHDRGQDGVMRL